MQIDIQSRGFSLTDSLLTYSERRLRSALSRCSLHIKRVAVRLSDINGPRGGADKRCHLQVVVPGMPDIVIEDTKTDLYTAINRAMDRARTTVTRKLGRKQRLLRHIKHHSKTKTSNDDEISA
ncbi:MAG TPA: HPF/RaiA family ribosome-associated protein [Gammaproteobacteria bacterium]|nr:HPF/RaiA family ribosome-associated protein [Gammaproteobacteria bacterium]